MLSPGTVAPGVLITVPAYNELPILAETIKGLWSGLQRLGRPYRIAIAEDGSTDGTARLVRSLKVEHPELITRTDGERRGRGFALRTLWESVDAEIYAFTDADLPAGHDALVRVIRAIEDGADIATASRYSPGARLQRPPLRSYVSRCYNWLVRNTFRDGIFDHQCGVKAFSRRAVEMLLARSQEDSWFWDTEVLVLATFAGLRIVEIPVEWHERKYARTPILRLLSDVKIHGAGYLRLKGRKASEESPARAGARPGFARGSWAPLAPSSLTVGLGPLDQRTRFTEVPGVRPPST